MALWRTRTHSSRRTHRTLLWGAGLAAVLAFLQLSPMRALAAPPAPPFHECPAVGSDTSCETLIVINADGTVTTLDDPSQGPYEGAEDTLIGVLNNMPVPLSDIKIASNTIAFGFEGDGICTRTFTGNGYCSSLPSGSFGYEGPDTTFSNRSANHQDGTANFTDAGGGLPAGSGTYFSLEENIHAANITVTPPPLVVFDSGSPTSANIDDPTAVSATITENGVPLSGVSLTFTLGSGAGAPTCTGTTNSLGTATCSITPAGPTGGTTIHVSFAGNASHDPASNSEPFTVTHEEATLAYTGPTTVTNGKPVTLTGTLTTDDPAAGTGIAGQSVTLSLGSGSSAQTCTGVSTASGSVSCTIQVVAQPSTSATVTMSFAGSSTYAAASASRSVVVQAVVSTPAVGAGSLPAFPLLLLVAGALASVLGLRRRRRQAVWSGGQR